MAEMVGKFYTAIPWIVYVFAALGLYILVGTLSSRPGEIQTISAYATMLLVFALPPLMPTYIKLIPGLYAVVDIRLVAPVLILLLAWSGNDGKWTLGVFLSTIPITASWLIKSLA